MTTIATAATIGLRLGQLRITHGWSGRWVAARIDVSPKAYYVWESGRTVPKLEFALRLATLYQTTVEALFTVADEGSG